MTTYASRIFVCLIGTCSLTGLAAAQGPGRRSGPPLGQPPPQAGVYTTVSGTVSQFNYDRDAEITGFLLNNNTLVRLPPRAALRVGTSLRTGETVQIAGFAQTSPSGFQTIEAQSITDSASGKKFTMPQPGAAAPYSGSGRIQQLNYGAGGAINGFLLDNGTLATVPPFAATNPSSIRVGAAIAYSGYARTTISGRTVVDVQTLIVNGQTLTIGAAGPGAGPAGGPPPVPAGAQGGRAPAPPVASGPSVPSSTTTTAPPPAGRTDEPPPPPASVATPAQPPRS
ncbi:MAG: hypothetical protein M3Y72_03910 [Acidobacteriota bacterium]|nr:hypothetical protein [Acidobacteriota bacterium]